MHLFWVFFLFLGLAGPFFVGFNRVPRDFYQVFCCFLKIDLIGFYRISFPKLTVFC